MVLLSKSSIAVLCDIFTQEPRGAGNFGRVETTDITRVIQRLATRTDLTTHQVVEVLKRVADGDDVKAEAFLSVLLKSTVASELPNMTQQKHRNYPRIQGKLTPPGSRRGSKPPAVASGAPVDIKEKGHSPSGGNAGTEGSIARSNRTLSFSAIKLYAWDDPATPNITRPRTASSLDTLSVGSVRTPPEPSSTYHIPQRAAQASRLQVGLRSDKFHGSANLDGRLDRASSLQATPALTIQPPTGPRSASTGHVPPAHPPKPLVVPSPSAARTSAPTMADIHGEGPRVRAAGTSAPYEAKLVRFHCPTCDVGILGGTGRGVRRGEPLRQHMILQHGLTPSLRVCEWCGEVLLPTVHAQGGRQCPNELLNQHIRSHHPGVRFA